MVPTCESQPVTCSPAWRSLVWLDGANETGKNLADAKVGLSESGVEGLLKVGQQDALPQPGCLKNASGDGDVDVGCVQANSWSNWWADASDTLLHRQTGAIMEVPARQTAASFYRACWMQSVHLMRRREIQAVLSHTFGAFSRIETAGAGRALVALSSGESDFCALRMETGCQKNVGDVLHAR